MPLDIRVEIPRTTSLRISQVLSPRRMLWAEKEALNRTARNVTKEAQKEVAREIGISKRKLAKRGRRVRFSSSSDRQHGRVSKARNATLRRLFTGVQFAGRPFNVIRFGGVVLTDKSGRGAGVSHKAWGQAQTATGPIWRAQVEGRPIVVRSGSSFRSVYGAGVAQMAQYPAVVRDLERVARERFAVHFASRVRYAYGPASHVRV